MDNQQRSWGTVAAMVVVTALGVASWQRSSIYADEETLWRDNVAKNPEAGMAYANLGLLMEWAKRPDVAAGYFQQAVRINPDEADQHNNLALALLQLAGRRRRFPTSRRRYRLDPDYADAYVNLGNALFQEGRVSEAFSHYQQALRLNPDSPLLHDDMGVALEKLGRVPEAVKQYQQALKLDPDFAVARQAIERLRASPQEHAVAVTEEAVPLTHGLLIRLQDQLPRGKRAHQHQQRRARQMKIRQHHVHMAKRVGRADKNVRRAVPRLDVAAGLQRPRHRRAHRHHAARAADGRRCFRRNREPLGVHLVFLDVLDLHGAERADADMQRDECMSDAGRLKLFQHVRREMESGRRRRHGARRAREHGLVTVAVRVEGLRRPFDVRRERRGPVRRQIATPHRPKSAASARRNPSRLRPPP